MIITDIDDVAVGELIGQLQLKESEIRTLKNKNRKLKRNREKLRAELNRVLHGKLTCPNCAEQFDFCPHCGTKMNRKEK